VYFQRTGIIIARFQGAVNKKKGQEKPCRIGKKPNVRPENFSVFFTDLRLRAKMYLQINQPVLSVYRSDNHE